MAPHETRARTRRWLARYCAALGIAVGTLGMPPVTRVEIPIAIVRTTDRRARGDRFDPGERAGRGMILTLPLERLDGEDAGSLFTPN